MAKRKELELEASIREFELEEQIEDLRKANINLQRQLKQAKDRNAELAEATYQGAFDGMVSLGPLRPVKPPKRDTRNKQELVALWDMGDWQASKVTTTYNFDVLEQRVEHYLDLAKEITDSERAHHPVRKCVIIFGGDMVEGLFNFPTQVFEVDATIHEQWERVAGIEMTVVRDALAYFDEVEVIGEPGNHGRIGSKRAVVPRADNIDRMTYTFARRMLFYGGETRLKWEDCGDNDIQRLEIGEYRALVCHGDEVGRMGYVAPDTFMKHVANWKSGSFRVNGEFWPFRDCYVHHYHQHRELPLPDGDGAVYWTGSTESDNRYARDGLASSATPTQRVHFINPEKGRVSSQHKIWLP